MSIQFGNSFIIIDLAWEAFKTMVASKKLSMQFGYNNDSSAYQIFAVDASIVYLTSIYTSDVPPAARITQIENDTIRSDFEANYLPIANKSLLPRNDDGLPLQTPEPRTGNELIMVTHNFCDKTTWYTDSARIEDENLSDSGDGLTWTSDHTHWIDMVHGKAFDEEVLASEAEHGYVVSVTVDDVPMTARAPYAMSGGDYSINYVSGSITSLGDNWSGKAVKATYSYAQTSLWKLLVDPGKRVDIEQAEAQFSSDVDMNDAIVFEVWVYNPYDLPNKVRYTWTSYKRFTNFIDEALGSYPVIPAIGGSSRGLACDVYGFPFRYGTIRKLNSSQGVELHVKLQDDLEFGGTHATATFYCTVRDE